MVRAIHISSSARRSLKKTNPIVIVPKQTADTSTSDHPSFFVRSGIVRNEGCART